MSVKHAFVCNVKAQSHLVFYMLSLYNDWGLFVENEIYPNEGICFRNLTEFQSQNDTLSWTSANYFLSCASILILTLFNF